MRALVLVAMCLCLPAWGMTLDDLTIGKHASGPQLSAKDLKGKVVFVVYWGTH